jgi:hypothetical protein
MIHTDFLTSALIPLTDTVVHLHGARGDGEFDALHRLLLQPQHQAITLLHVVDGLPAQIQTSTSGEAGAVIYKGGQEFGRASSAPDLAELLARNPD